MQAIEFFNYLLKSSICLIFFYSFYLIILKNQHCFQFNRFYLLVTLLLSMVLPLIKMFSLSINSSVPINSSIFIMPEVIVFEQEIPKSATNWLNLFYIIYGLGAIYIIVRFAYQLSSILKFIYKNKKHSTKNNGYYIIDTNGKIPTSSFYKYILWDNTQQLSSSDKTQIIKHEQIHIKENHTIDVILTVIFQTIFWFNPIIWFFKKSLTDIHEYIADYNAFDELNSYTKLLAKQALLPQGISIAHSFKSIDIIKRINMLNTHSKPTPFYRYIIIAMVFSFMLFTMSFSVEKTNNWKTENSLPNNTANTNISTSDEVFTIVEQPAFPDGGMTTFYEYISRNISYPKTAREKNIEGRVYVEFIIEKNGTISNTKVLKGIHPECDAIALKILSDAPKWNPGKQNGKTVKQKIVLPISFRLI